MPFYRMFWNNQTRFSIVSDVMARNRFDNLRSYFHVNDNTHMLPREHSQHDKLFKTRPFLNAIRDNMKKVHVNVYIAVDEIIILFKGRSIMKQYNKNKPHKSGIKMFALASSNGLVHDFEIYVGKGTLPPSNHGLGISGDVVMRLIECIPKNENYKVSMDNWFNSYNLQSSDKQLKSGERGKFDSRVDTNNNIVVTKWNDSKIVHVISNYKGPLPVENVKRWGHRKCPGNNKADCKNPEFFRNVTDRKNPEKKPTK
ncbi:piggyBac transposable element-derived protein 2-like, partial [Myzus persicae]|uniref:piggyBac transposable element-derived protein 2-like n=1 Tax=Myzus persicae TaxID=13164 RepID=UPI000B930F76